MGFEISADAISHGVTKNQALDADVHVCSLLSGLRCELKMRHPNDGVCRSESCAQRTVDAHPVGDRAQSGTHVAPTCSSGDLNAKPGPSVACVARVLCAIPRSLIVWIAQVQYGTITIDRPVLLPEELKIDGIRFRCDWIAVRCSSSPSDSTGERGYYYALVRHLDSGQWLKVHDDDITWMGTFGDSSMRPIVAPSGRGGFRNEVPAAAGYSVLSADEEALAFRNDAARPWPPAAVKGVSGAGASTPSSLKAVQTAGVRLREGRAVVEPGRPAPSEPMPPSDPAFGVYVNGGNTCSFAAVLQALRHQPLFLRQLECALSIAPGPQWPWPDDWDPRQHCSNLLELLVMGNTGARVPLDRHRWLATVSPDGRPGIQQDATEFYCFLVDQCGLDTVPGSPPSFHFTCQSTVECRSCGTRTTARMPETYLTIGLPKLQVPLASRRGVRSPPLHLEALLLRYFEPEPLVGVNRYDCGKCGGKVRRSSASAWAHQLEPMQKVRCVYVCVGRGDQQPCSGVVRAAPAVLCIQKDARKVFLLETVPPVFVMSLNRFVEAGDKREDIVLFPSSLSIPSECFAYTREPSIYTLTATVVHLGSSQHHGHYVAYARSQEYGATGAGQWVRYDDGSVSCTLGPWLQVAPPAASL
jgi:hypothetical protein